MNPTNKDPNLLEDALRSALRREAAPDDFASSVLARVAQADSRRRTVQTESWLNIFSQPLVRWAAFAAVSICLVLGSVYYRDLQRERAKGEAAKQQLMLALRIAGSKLQLAKQKVNEINQSRPETRPPSNGSRSRS